MQVGERSCERGTCTSLLSAVCCLRVSAHVFMHTEMLSRGICCHAMIMWWLVAALRFMEPGMKPGLQKAG